MISAIALKKQFRCTRNTPYVSEDELLGKSDLSARQGYYVWADSEEDAIAQMSERFPSDNKGFTVKVWS